MQTPAMLHGACFQQIARDSTADGVPAAVGAMPCLSTCLHIPIFTAQLLACKQELTGGVWCCVAGWRASGWRALIMVMHIQRQ
jgi:hypothetical protein